MESLQTFVLCDVTVNIFQPSWPRLHLLCALIQAAMSSTCSNWPWPITTCCWSLTSLSLWRQTWETWTVAPLAVTPSTGRWPWSTLLAVTLRWANFLHYNYCDFFSNFCNLVLCVVDDLRLTYRWCHFCSFVSVDWWERTLTRVHHYHRFVV